MGQEEYATRGAGRDGAATEVISISAGTIPIAEFKVIATVLFQTADSKGNTVKSSIESVESGVDYKDWRLSDIGSAGNSGGDGFSLWSTDGTTMTPTDNSVAISMDGGAGNTTDINPSGFIATSGVYTNSYTNQIALTRSDNPSLVQINTSRFKNVNSGGDTLELVNDTNTGYINYVGTNTGILKFTDATDTWNFNKGLLIGSSLNASYVAPSYSILNMGASDSLSGSGGSLQFLNNGYFVSGAPTATDGNGALFTGFSSSAATWTFYNTIADTTLSDVENTFTIDNANSKVTWTGDIDIPTGKSYMINGVPISGSSLWYEVGTGNLFSNDAGNLTVSGASNIASGAGAGGLLVGGGYNNLSGVGAGSKITSGLANTFVGSYSGQNATGNHNSAIGYASFRYNTSGSYNTAIGREAGARYDGGNLTTASYCTYIGASANAKANNALYEIVIGYNVYGNGSNSVTIGGTTNTGTYLTGGTFIKEQASASTDTTGYGQLYAKNTDSNLYYVDDSGSETQLTGSGSFTITATGMTTTVTGTAIWQKNGDIINLTIPDLRGTSNANTLTLTGVPADIRPATTQYLGLLGSADNSLLKSSMGALSSGGVITCYFLPNVDATGWEVSNIKGIYPTTVTYKI